MTPRRRFLKQLGLGIPAIASIGQVNNRQFLPIYHYPSIRSVEDAKNEEGLIAVRLEMSSETPQKIARWEMNIDIKKGKHVRTDNWFLNKKEDRLQPPQTVAFSGQAAKRSTDILVIWIENAGDKTEVVIHGNTVKKQMLLADLVQHPEITWKEGDTVFTANLLQFHEIGEIQPSEAGIGQPEHSNAFRFAIMADPQGGNPETSGVDSPTRMKIHNAFIEESIRRVNELDPQPVFTIVNGDFVDSKGQEGNFLQMMDYYKELRSPLLIELGNHETAYSAKFTPGYNMEAFANYFAAQKEVNGLEKLLYSFNLGNWHFIIWPDPLRRNFWQTHPHYVDWLAKDLAKYRDRPTIFIHHVPLHPIGINPLVNYVEEVEVRRVLLDILAEHGNVKYIFSGHVHIPYLASLKTARTYKGMKMINLPAAGFRPRGFGEQDIDGGPSQGIAFVDIEGEEATVSFQSVIKRTFVYPDSFPELKPDEWPLWFTPKWELPAAPLLVNGGFENGLAGWHRRFVYQEDHTPSSVCEIRRRKGSDSFNSLYLFCKTRPYMSPGQDRLPQTINRLCQAVAVDPKQKPVLTFEFQVDSRHFDPEKWAGAYIWIEGFAQSHKKCNILYSAGKSPRDPGGWQSKSFQAWYQYVDLPVRPGKWHQVALNVATDMQRGDGKKDWESINIDRLVINIGVWTQNDREDQRVGIYADNFKLAFPEKTAPSTLDHIPLKPKKPEDIYHKRVDHIAGEHVLYVPVD